MSFNINKKFNNLPISLKVLCAFFAICCSFTVISAITYYRHAHKVVVDSIRNQAVSICDHAEHEFKSYFANSIEQELKLLETSSQLNNFLMSSEKEAFIYRVEVERLFLSLSKGSKTHLSTTFLDTLGHERIAIYDNKRKRTFRSLEEIVAEGSLVGRNIKKTFH